MSGIQCFLVRFGVGGEGKNLQQRRDLSARKILTSGPLRMHYPHSGAKIRVFEQNTDIIKFWLFYSLTAHEYSTVKLKISPSKYKPPNPVTQKTLR